MITTLDNVLPESDTNGLPSLEQIAQGYCAKAKVSIRSNPLTFAYRLFRFSDYLVESAELLENQVLIDLGAGRTLDGYIFSGIAGARAYIAVEACHTQRLFERMTSSAELGGASELNKIIRKMNDLIGTVREYDRELVKKLKTRMQEHLKEGAGKLPAVLVAEDMLTALKRIPKDSVSILACGIDRNILPEDDYVSEVELEISRVLHPEGGYVGVCSRFQPTGLRNITNDQKDYNFKRYGK